MTTEEKAKRYDEQGDTNETINRDELVQGVLRGAAINLITWIDYNAAEGNMCLSNMECKDIADALVSGDWDKIYAYIKKKLEKQEKQKPAFDFNVVDWKPSDEQMKLLEELVEDNDQRHFHTLLKSLYEQLKRLKEE